MADFNRRAALIGAALSTSALAFPASALAKEARTVPDIARELSAALEQAGESWQVIVTAKGHQINLDGPANPWQQFVEQLDVWAAGGDGWLLHAGRGVETGKQQPWAHLYSVSIVDEVHSGHAMKVQRDEYLRRVA